MNWGYCKRLNFIFFCVLRYPSPLVDRSGPLTRLPSNSLYPSNSLVQKDHGGFMVSRPGLAARCLQIRERKWGTRGPMKDQV